MGIRQETKSPSRAAVCGAVQTRALVIKSRRSAHKDPLAIPDLSVLRLFFLFFFLSPAPFKRKKQSHSRPWMTSRDPRKKLSRRTPSSGVTGRERQGIEVSEGT